MNQPHIDAAAPKLRLQDQRALFSTPLLTFSVDNHQDLNTRLLADIAAWRQQSAGIQSSNQHGWHSERNFFARPEASFREISQNIQLAMAKTATGLNPKLDRKGFRMLLQGWVNVNERGAYNTPHDHPDHILSGVYYVKVTDQAPKDDSRSGQIEFIDSRGLSLLASKSNFILGNAKHRLRPKPGMMLIFPSSLMHWVYPHEEDEERVSIAFNMRLGPRSEQKEDRTT